MRNKIFWGSMLLILGLAPIVYGVSNGFFENLTAIGTSHFYGDTTVIGDTSADVLTINSTTTLAGGLTFENSESLNTATDAVFDFTRNDAGTVTLLCSDNNAVCDIVYDAGGAAALTVGSADVTSVSVIVDNDVQIKNGATGNVTMDFRDYADTTDDDMAHAILTTNCTDTSTGAEDCDFSIGVVEAGAAAETRLSFDADGAITLGSTNNGGVTLNSSGVIARNNATGSVTFDFRDYADTTDDDMAHALFTTNCTDAGTGAEDCDFSVGIVEAGAAAETRLNFDADGDITIGSATNGAVVSLGTSMSLRNSVTGNVVQDFRDYADSADDDMAHVEIMVNLTDATTGAEDADYSIAVAEAGAATEVRFLIDGDGDMTLGSANNGGHVLLGTGVSQRNNVTGSVTYDFRDYADSADDDMAHAIVTINCTDATTGAEDCDYTLGVVEAGAAAETRFSIDADGGIEVGSANNASVSLTTDGTGDGEAVLPVDSVSTGEILDGTIVAADLADTLCLQFVTVEINPTEAGATDDFINLVDNTFSTTETDEDMFLVSTAVKIDNLRVEVDVAPGAGNDDWKVTVRDDAASSTLTCAIDETATNCNDAVGAATVAANSKLDILVDSSGGAADPTAAAVMTISFCITQ